MKVNLDGYGISIDTEEVCGTVDLNDVSCWYVPEVEKKSWRERLLAWYQRVLLRLLRRSGWDDEE